jgi:hypothetical protein
LTTLVVVAVMAAAVVMVMVMVMAAVMVVVMVMAVMAVVVIPRCVVHRPTDPMGMTTRLFSSYNAHPLLLVDSFPS